MEAVASAYEAAALVALPGRSAQDLDGLYNVYRLSPAIVSGSEPGGEAAFGQLAAWGVRTILSVDGKVPDVEAAARHGMRYVHVPIQYSGIEAAQRLEIAKTFRELEAPFYVHCFHGKHRGPAAAAIGRVVRDGATRQQAIAEMRQWCNTAPTYEGLYAAVATGPLPSEEETAASDFDFAPAHRVDGFRGAMVAIPRKWDLLKASRRRGWRDDPAHPDVVALEEARQLQGLFVQSGTLEESRTAPADFQGWLMEAAEASARLAQALDGRGDGWRLRAEEATAALGRTCASCHAAYRND